MKRSTWLIFAAVVAMLMGATVPLTEPVEAEVRNLAYVADGAGGAVAELRIIDLADGSVVRDIGSIGYSVTGLAIDPFTGELYGTTGAAGSDAPRSLLRIDRETGAGTVIGELSPTQTAADITFGPDGTLYGWMEPDADDLAVIDLESGEATVVGDSGLSTEGSGLTWFDDALLLTGEGADGRLHSISPSTGEATPITTLDGDGSEPIAALDTDCDGIIFGVRDPEADPRLITIDFSGAVMLRGSLPENSDALAIDCAVAPGYRLVGADGGLFAFGASGFQGSTGNIALNSPVIDGASQAPRFEGYWLLAQDGGVFAFNAPFHGSLGDRALVQPAVAIASTPTGDGYWIVQANGRVTAFGDAVTFGDAANFDLNAPIIDIIPTPSGGGYWLIGLDGGVFSYGDASFHGSTGGMTLNAPVIGMLGTQAGDGYYLFALDGGVFAFGEAPFYGSTGGMTLNAPVIGGLSDPDGAGYWMVATDGGVFAFEAAFLGSMGDRPLNSPVIDLIE